MSCSACKLVSYCSQDCQGHHWKIYKKACKNALRESSWSPACIREGRIPSFCPVESDSDHEGNENSGRDASLCAGLPPWEESPVLDLLNLSQNENDQSMDLNIAFIASGDIRHMVKTVNSFPVDYDGHLKILLNVSLFMPQEYKEKIDRLIADYLLSTYFEADSPEWTVLRFGSRGLLYCKELILLRFFRHAGTTTRNPETFRDAHNKVMKNPSMQDHRDCKYNLLRPSHRASFDQYRADGLVLPFGADRSAFTEPNRSLSFSFDGIWAATDHVNPLNGWDDDWKAPWSPGRGCIRLSIFLPQGQTQHIRPEDTQHTYLYRLFGNGSSLSLSLIIKTGQLTSCNIPASTSTTFIEFTQLTLLTMTMLGLDWL